MKFTRRTAALGLLIIETGLAVLGVLIHYSFTAEYGDVTAKALDEFRWGLPTGIGGLALAVVGTAALVTALVAPARWTRASALAIPVLMVMGMVAVTPAALERKLEEQYDAAPQCVSNEDLGPGPGAQAEQESQQAFESIEHVGYFGGGGGSGVGGCDRAFLLLEDVDVLQHYRAVLPEAGWRVVEDDGDHLRAERDGMAFEVLLCSEGGVVWAGRDSGVSQARCDQPR